MHYRWMAIFVLSGTSLALVRYLHAAENPVSGPLVVRQSLRLRADIRVPPQGVGIQISAPNVRIDLDGHRIEGDGSGVGIEIDGQTGCLIAGGTIRACERGVEISRGGSHRLLRLAILEHTGAGVWVIDSRHNEVTDCVINGSAQFGVLIEGGGGNRLAADRLETNRGLGDSGGITLKHTRENLVRGNTIRGNGRWGLRLREGSERNRILNNQIAGSGLPLPGDLWMPHPGLVLDDGATDNELQGNTLTGNSSGLFLWEGAVRNRIERNVAVENISLDIVDLNPTCEVNVWIDNRIGRANHICN
jgi:parallel beta-helix repeat protein